MISWAGRLAAYGVLLLAIFAVVPLREVAGAQVDAELWLVAAGFALMVPKLLAAALRMLALVRAQGFRFGLGDCIIMRRA